MAANEIGNLKVSDFFNGYDPETGVKYLDLRRQKMKIDFFTFLSPEASKAVKKYLDFRAREPKTRKSDRFIVLFFLTLSQAF
ncbi:MULTISPECIES: hypothetical protein [unclassified Methanosarcina]|uniref:hypothetical protein n=1 Tax=unclassified Methanosarcina TaxID=2644672 RepID=UPI000615D332|nr:MULTISPECIES: hypothetical protein [unclassified Methanosarcina]AKB22777.1 hypothetical protein MSWH1_2506 [Methanosarcina sp. WH1]